MFQVLYVPLLKSLLNLIEMKKLVIFFLIFCFAFASHAQDTLRVKKNDTIIIQDSQKEVILINESRDNTDKLNLIIDNTEKTSKNTEPTTLNKVDWDEYLNIGLALIAAFGTLLTFQQIQITNKQQSIKKKFQLNILSDLIRHLYRNKVCICASHQKLEDFGFDTHYPSEEHILKLKVLPEDLHFERFNNSPDHYDALHELELKFRNFNIEVDVALEHLKSQKMDRNVKIRDFETLEFKSQYLTDQTLKLINRLGFKWADDKLKEELQKTSVRYTEDLKTNNEDDGKEIATIPIAPRQSDRKNYYDNLGLTEELDADIRSEYEKINIIAFG